MSIESLFLWSGSGLCLYLILRYIKWYCGQSMALIFIILGCFLSIVFGPVFVLLDLLSDIEIHGRSK